MPFAKLSKPLPRSVRVTRRTTTIAGATNTAGADIDNPATTTMTHVAGAADVTAAQPPAGSNPPLSEPDVAAVLTEDLRRDICEVVKYGLQGWCRLARFNDVSINGPIAMGSPGCLKGPNFRSEMMLSSKYYAHRETLGQEIMEMAVRGVTESFDLWRSLVVMPGLPVFPSFVAVALPLMPPTPSVPFLLGQLPSSGASFLTNPNRLRDSILDQAPQVLTGEALTRFCDGLSKTLASGFSAWTATHLVTGMMGEGPVPTYNPPGSPVGPVVGGSVLPVPGALSNTVHFPLLPYPIA